MDYIAQPNDYWIALNAINITRNALGNPNRIQGSVASGAAILCYIEGVDGLGYDNGHRFRTWPLTISPTYFNSNTAKYVYVAIPRTSSVGTQAVVVFPSEKLDIYGVNANDEQLGSTDYYYIWLQGILTATNGTSNREWQQAIDFGKKGTDEDLYDDTSSEWYQYSKVNEVVTFLKNIAMKAGTTFQNLILGNKELTGVATSDMAYTDSDVLVATPGYVESQYLSKTHESTAQEQVGFLKGLWVGVRNLYEITANGIAKLKSVITEDVTAKRVATDNIQSPNYTGDGVADTGFRLTNAYNGHSKLTIDEIYVRMKAVFESLEVRERTYTGGDQIWSCAGNRITRVDYLGNVETADHVPQTMNVHADGRPEGQGQGDVYSVPVPGDTYGYSDVKVPWLLRQMPLLARAKVFARYRKVRIVINEPAGNSANRAAASESPLANIRRARCYFIAKDDDMEVHNWWRINDLARCQTMNLANTTHQTYISGEDQKAGNIFWWRKVIGVSYEPVPLDDGKQYHYFDVAFDYEYEQSHPEVMATSVMEGSDIPAAQDSVVQFGNTIIEGRMNLMMMEVNGSDAVGYNPTTDAPCLKAYRGVYCFDLDKSWVGGKACKMKLSPKSGYEFYGPNFKQVTEYDVVPVPVDRGLWLNITPTRDDYREHALVRKCYYYDKVSHNGSYWLCSIVDGAHWVDGNGDYISDATYSALTEEQKALCSRKQNYTIEEPSANSIDWTEVVSKGDSITKQSEVAYYIKNTTGVRPAENDPNWSTTKPTIGKGEWLFTKIVITWSDNSKTVLYTDERNPNDGAAGQDIIVDGSTEMKYYVGDSNTTHPAESSSDWKDLSQVTQTQGKWLWSKATTWYRKASSAAGSKDAGHSVNYNVSYISKDGKTGRGISSITEYYQATNSSASRQVPTSESGWDTDPNLSHLTDKWDANHKYLWNMEKTVYTNVDGSTTTEYSIPQILAIWTKDGDAGRGIDSIQNKYKVTGTNQTPAREHEGGTGWSNDPITPAQGQYLWNYEVITWINPYSTTYTDVQMIGYAGADSTVPGPPGPASTVPGPAGKDGWMITANPANVIITQSLNNNTSSFSSATVCFAAKKGSTAATIASIGTPSSSTFNVSASGNSVIVSSPKASGSSYYTEGSFSVNVNVTDPDTGSTVTFSVTVLCYANLLGTWKETVEAGVRTVVAEEVDYDFLNGVLVVNNKNYTQIASAAQEFNQWASNYQSASGESVNNLNTRISNSEGNISTVERKIPNPDLFNSTAWIVNTKVDSEYKSADYDSQNARFYDASHSVDDIYSPIVALSAGKYTFSGFVPSDRDFETSGNTIVLCSGITKPDESYTSIPADSVGVVSGETKVINGATYHRCFATFTLSSAANCSINLWGSARDGQVAYPKLEKGSDPTYMSIDSASYIKQTADEIDLSIRNGLNNTGINITTGKVTVEAEDFTIGKDGTQVFGVDANTGLTTMQDVDIKGSLMYHKTKIDKSGNYIGMFQMFDAGGNPVTYNFNGLVKKTVMIYDTLVIGGDERTGGHAIFDGIIEDGYTVLLPPAKLFPGMRIKIINGTVANGSNPKIQKPSKINFAVVYREDTDEYAVGDISYAMNLIASVTPITVKMNDSAGEGGGTFVGAPDDVTYVKDYTPQLASHFTCYGLSGDNTTNSPVRYKRFELMSQENPYTSSGYAWIIIEAQEG